MLCPTEAGNGLPSWRSTRRSTDETAGDSFVNKDSACDAAAGEQPFAKPREAECLPLVALAILIALKISVLLAFGPTMSVDTTGYTDYAAAILDGSFKHVDLAASAQPVTLTRTIGLPALIAGAMAVAGDHWAWPIVLLQFAASIWATVYVYRLARAFKLGVWLSLFVCAAQATTMQYVVDQTVLTDSLCGSTMTIATCMLGLSLLNRRPATLIAFLIVGLLIAAAFLLRPVVEYVVAGFAPLVLAAIALLRTRVRQAAAAALVLLPVVVTHLAYVAWNLERVGAPVVTTIGQAALFAAIVEAAPYDDTIFSGSSPVDIAGRRTAELVKSPPTDRIFGHDVEPGLILHRDYGWDAIRINREATKAYLLAWRDHPVAMIHHVFYHLSETQLHQAFRPTETIRDVLMWNTGSEYHFGRWTAVRAGDWWQIPAMVWHFLDDTISVFIFCAFFLVTPIRLFREGFTPETNVSAGCWCAYVVVGLLYAAVHLEPRYLTPVLAGSIAIGVVNIVWLLEQYRQSRSLRPVAI
jgi:hypothetical protein